MKQISLVPLLKGTTNAQDTFREVLLNVFICISLLCVFAGDSMTALGFTVWVLYLVPLALSLFLWRPIAPVFVAVCATIFMVINFFLAPEGVGRDIAQFNRAVGLICIWSVAIAGYFFILNKVSILKQKWLQAGLAKISVDMSGQKNIKELADSVLLFLADYARCDAGVVYVQNEGLFEYAGSLGVPKGGAPDYFTVEDGLLAQSVKEKRMLRLHEIPDGYLTLGSSFGKTKPRHLLIAPCTAESKVNVVIELGFMHQYYEVVPQLMENIADLVGTAMRSANYRLNLQKYLEETQRQTEELQAQSEELRVSNEELEEQSRALQESQSHLEQQQAEMEQTNTQLEEQAQMLEAHTSELARNKADLQLRARELEQASQYKTDFLANMSHELRTPLNSTLILAKLLSDNRDDNLTDEQVRYAETIYSSGNDLLVLINDILDLSKIEAGHMEIVAEDAPLSKLTDDLKRTFEETAKQKNLTFKTSIAKACPTAIFTDTKRLEQILKNLLSNAVKFTEKGSVTLNVSMKDKNTVQFAVKDSGIGIPEEQQEMVFEAFRQADGTTNRKYGGTGLGLSITRELTRLLGGEITLESESGKGSTFTISLPLEYDATTVTARMPQEAPQPQNAPQKISRNMTTISDESSIPSPVQKNTLDDDREVLNGNQRVILVVEDDESFARIMYELAHEMDFQCLLAQTADDALITAMQYLPNAVILDVGLPDHSGLSVLDRLKQDSRTRHIPVHIVSGNDHEETAMALGAVGYMLKPVKREELMETLTQLEDRLVQRMRRVLVVEDDLVQQESLQKLLGTKDVETMAVGTATECLNLLKEQTFDCMVLDLSLPDASGYTLLETLSKEEAYSFPPVIVYTGRDLSNKEEQQLRRYSKSIIIKGAKSPERLLDEVTLFLHQVVADLPAEQQRMLKKAKNRDTVLEGRRILVVEDDIRNVYALTSIFEPRGATIQIARNGIEALDALEKAHNDKKIPDVDLVLMDVMMPEMDGMTCTLEIRKKKEWKNLPIIMLTAKAMKGDQERCIEAGANDYMSKPLDVEKLLSLVRVWMPR